MRKYVHGSTLPRAILQLKMCTDWVVFFTWLGRLDVLRCFCLHGRRARHLLVQVRPVSSATSASWHVYMILFSLLRFQAGAPGRQRRRRRSLGLVTIIRASWVTWKLECRAGCEVRCQHCNGGWLRQAIRLLASSGDH
jgi:hypothetical protein